MISRLDSGGNFHGYIGDLCRIGILGQPDAQLKELLQEVEEIQQVARKVIRPGTAGGEIVTAGEAAVKSSPHRDILDFTAHGVGLISQRSAASLRSRPGTDAAYDADRPLQPGMVISIETALPHPTRGYIKLEDTLIVTENGWEAAGDGARGWNVAGQN